MMAKKSSIVSRRERRGSNYRHLETLESRILMAAGPELWFYVQTNLAVAANVTALTTPNTGLIDRAAAAGYTYMMLADTKLSYDGIAHPGSGFSPATHLANTRNVIAYAKSKGITFVPATFDLGRADWVLTQIDENLVEGQAVIGANFTVNAGGTALTFNPQDPTLNNPSFVTSASWSLDAGRAVIDTTTGHTDSTSLKIVAGGGRGLAIQTVTLIPHRQYHVSYWVKKDASFSGDEFIKIYDPSGTAPHFLEDHQYESALTSISTSWAQKDYVFDSGDSTSAQFRVGSWGSTTGNIWFDDVSLTEIALHNVVRNTDSLFKIYRPDGTPLVEGVDYNPVKENWTINSYTFALYRTPLTVTIPAGSSLHAGDLVKIDYDAAQPVDQAQYSVDANLPAVQTYYHNVMTQLRTSFVAGTPVMVGGYDEIRTGNSETGQYASGLTAAQSLAQSFLSTYNTLRAVDPTVPIYTWSDMFDPNHNAKNNYYNWHGDLSASGGSWATLPKDVTILNWNRTNTSLKFFGNTLGNPQIISGYYDSGNGTTSASNEVAAAVGAAGVRGLMYTTWTNSYTQLENYAASAKAAWAASITPPTISSVYVRGTTWTAPFLNYLSTSGKGDATLGYKIPTGANQLKALPWNNLNQVSVTFSENVTVAQASLALTGINTANYTVNAFSYNSTSHTATWTLNGPITLDTLQIKLPATGTGAVTDTATNPLDGEWTDATSSVSGNGVSGGNFTFHFKVLPGDIDGSGLVDGADFDVWFTHLLQSTFDSSQGDLNGDGMVDGSDFDLWFSHLGQSSPASLGGSVLAQESSSLSPQMSSSTPLTLASSQIVTADDSLSSKTKVKAAKAKTTGSVLMSGRSALSDPVLAVQQLSLRG